MFLSYFFFTRRKTKFLNQKFQNPNLFPLTGCLNSGGYPQPILFTLVIGNPTVSALGTENPSPVSLAYPSTQKVQCKLLLPVDFRLAKRLFVTYIIYIHYINPFRVFKVRWQLSNTPTHFRVIELNFYRNFPFEIAILGLLRLKF